MQGTIRKYAEGWDLIKANKPLKTDFKEDQQCVTIAESIQSLFGGIT